jgi:homogentisate phytyltransferase / homogentisate geranylgeranyltransferase
MRQLLAFARPHTIIGTVLAVIGLWAMAGAWAADAPAAAGVGALVVALVAALATNVYIVGINQLTDVDIDRINKPFLPLAAGTVSMRTGRIWVVASGVIAVGTAAVAGPYLLSAVVIGLVVGTAYSVRPLRLKRYHVAAAASITSVRALAVNLLVYLHFQHRIDGSTAVPLHVLALTGMVLGLTIAIAWFKDIPDAIGDARHGIATLVLRVGVRPVLGVGLAVLVACYTSLIVAGVVGLAGVDGTVLVIGHVGLLIGLVAIVRRTDLADTESLRSFYANIWRLFFVEYLVFPVAALAAIR